MKYLELAVGAILVYNFVLSRFLGICPFLGVSKKLSTALGMSGAVITVMTLASAITAVIYKYLLRIEIGGKVYDLQFLQVLLFILVIAALVQFVEIVLKKYIPSLHKSLGVYLPLITTNCAVLGVALNNISDGYSFAESMVSSFGCGLGFLLAMVIFSGVRSRVEQADPPEAFRGLPITLVAASIVSLAFFGFAGVAENLFL